MHEVFDIDRWKREFSLEALRAQAREFVLDRARQLPDEYLNQSAVDRHIQLMRPKPQMIAGPRDIAVLEQLRDEFDMARYSKLQVDCDVFAFAQGHAPDPRMTRTGGRPFWTSNASWPTDSNGNPMMFIGQLCFVDSRDVVAASLPGDILSLFMPVDPGERYEWYEPDQYQYVWQSVSEPDRSKELQAPTFSQPIEEVFAVRHRTMDFELRDQADALYLPNRDMVDCAIVEGTKIGGLPHWQQDPEDVEGVFLGSISSVHVVPEHEWPLLNRQHVTYKSCFATNYLMFGDVGLINLFLKEDGSVTAKLSCY